MTIRNTILLLASTCVMPYAAHGVRKFTLAVASGAALMSSSLAPAQAEPAVGIIAVCPLTGPGILVCGSVGTILHELVQAGNGKRPFGANGEIMKVLAVPVQIVAANVK